MINNKLFEKIENGIKKGKLHLNIEDFKKFADFNIGTHNIDMKYKFKDYMSKYDDKDLNIIIKNEDNNYSPIPNFDLLIFLDEICNIKNIKFINTNPIYLPKKFFEKSFFKKCIISYTDYDFIINNENKFEDCILYVYSITATINEGRTHILNYPKICIKHNFLDKDEMSKINQYRGGVKGLYTIKDNAKLIKLSNILF